MVTFVSNPWKNIGKESGEGQRKKTKRKIEEAFCKVCMCGDFKMNYIV